MVHSVVGVWRIVGAGDQRLQRWECSDRQAEYISNFEYDKTVPACRVKGNRTVYIIYCKVSGSFAYLLHLVPGLEPLFVTDV